jgi:hypothetical protein
MIPANYSLACNMARKVLKQYKIVEVPTDLRKMKGWSIWNSTTRKPLTGC